MALKGKVALVTGSTSGIGLGIARALAAESADIMLNGFGDAAAIETLRAGLETEFSVKVAYDGADLSKPEGCAELVAKTQSTLGSLDVLVNNAGIQFVAPVEEFPEAKWDAIIAINLSAIFYGMKAAIPGMKAKGWGGSSTSPRRMVWWRARIKLPMWRPSMALSGRRKLRRLSWPMTGLP
jgi:3-hydroxybutyrate dehydrogenase